MEKIVLASASPRRYELMEKHGYKFSVLATDADESVAGKMPPGDFVLEISKRKAYAALKELDNGTLIIAADTVVVIGGEILGKPADEKDAKKMLTKLSGEWHEVYTGVTVLKGGVCRQEACVSRVKFKKLTEGETDGYIATGEPMDKAGAYAIQGKGAALIERIEGEYTNVVGLPMERLKFLIDSFVAI